MIESSCNTYPNDKLLQRWDVSNVTDMSNSCNTYPNDKLLQREKRIWAPKRDRCNTYPNDKLIQLWKTKSF